MLQGWVSVYRQIQDHWLWKEKPFSKGQAWIDMLLLANHEDTEVLSGRKVIVVQLGSFLTSEVKLSERWGWSRQKVRDFLILLEKQKMITKKSDNKKTTISISNYAVYQSYGNSELDSKKTAKKQQKNTNNNENNENNNNSLKESYGTKKFVPPTLEEVRAYCFERKNSVDAERFLDYYQTNGWVQGKGKPIKDWKACVRTWERNTIGEKTQKGENQDYSEIIIIDD